MSFSQSAPVSLAAEMTSSVVSKKFRVFFAKSLALLLLFAFCANPTRSFAKDQLPPRYKQWLEREVGYIITNDEKTTFRKLPSDADRDKFMERFWDLRNPDPGAPTNTYKEEHYKRLEYASQHFSPSGSGDGWATDMGRVWITLGPPQQKARYVSQSGVRGMEIWFYSSTHPALPPFFYVVFYEKEFGDFRLYSPYMDGPNKLVTGIQAEQGRVQSVKQIDRILGREVALTTLSLIPGEPVNMNDAESTMQSDLLLGNIKNLANHPFTIQALKMRSSLNESVSHRVVLPGELLNIITVPLRDPLGLVRLHYALRLTQPEDFAVAQKDDRYYYSLEAQVRVLSPDGKEIFTRDHKAAKYISKDELDAVKGKPVVYEGWVPLVPGKYKVSFVFTNVLSKTAFTGEREVTVPAVGPQDLFITEPIAFSQAEQVNPVQASYLPFTIGGLRFRPYIGKEVALVPGQDLQFLYQLWHAPRADEGAATTRLMADYAYGRPSVPGSAQTIHEEIAANQFDPAGSLVSGKKIPTADMAQGNYRLTITVANPVNQQKRFSVMPFHIVSDDPSTSDGWRIDDDGLADFVGTGEADLDRGLTFLAAKENDAAAKAFQAALNKNPKNELARARLVDYYFQHGEFSKVTDIFSKSGITAQTEDSTILSAADSLDRTGDTRKAADLIESSFGLRTPTAPLYLALASYYQRLGETSKADALQRRGKELMAQTSSKPADQ